LRWSLQQFENAAKTKRIEQQPQQHAAEEHA
jgi:hypothetical protein